MNMETFEKAKEKKKGPVGIVAYVVVCCIFIACWMTFSFLLERCEVIEFFFGRFIIERVYDEELEWMEGKSVEEIEERFGPTEAKDGDPVYFVWYDWYISIRSALHRKPEVHCNTIPLPSQIENSPFKMQGWRSTYYIANFVFSVIVCGFLGVIWLIVNLIRRERKRRRDVRNICPGNCQE